jgi:hypothetical protein
MNTFKKNIELGKSQRMKKNELKAKYVKTMGGKSYSESYKKNMGFEHKTPGPIDTLMTKLPVPDVLSNPFHGTGKTKSIKNKAMTDRLIGGGKKRLVKGT